MTASPDVTVIISLQGAPGLPGALYVVDDGVANSLEVTIPTPITEVPEGLFLLVKVAATNTGAVTISVNGLDPEPVTFAGEPITAGVLVAGGLCLMAFDGDEFQLLAFAISSTGGGGGSGSGLFFPSGQVAAAATIL